MCWLFPEIMPSPWPQTIPLRNSGGSFDIVSPPPSALASAALMWDESISIPA